MMRRISTADPGFDVHLAELRTPPKSAGGADVPATVAAIIAEVRARGDAALLEYTNRFDRRELRAASELELPRDALASAWTRIPAELRDALAAAAARIEDFHRRALRDSWQYRDADGNLLGQRVLPLERAGIYVPGGKASYPSSVLMNAIPARVAGVEQIAMAVPAPGGELADAVLAAAHIARIDRVFTIGGAQAVAAFALGTALVPRVDKIVGPGNVYVAEAKRQLFGEVGIDMIAGPSEVVVVCDGTADPDWIALDLFAQAEHDELAQSILISPDAAFLAAVEASMTRLLPQMSRRAVIERSLAGRGALVHARDLEEAIAISNRIAPEHLELAVAAPEQLLDRVRHAGAVFLGHHTPEALGDYCAGPSHVLPTAGTARFFSPLGVEDFQRRSSLIGCSERGARTLGVLARRLAECEGLGAHALSAGARVGEGV